MAETLTEKVYRKLRDDIINLRIPPGEKISEVKLADKYKVSRAPIRNVIQKLQQENLVVVKPQVGTIIMPVSLEKAGDILEIRLWLEPRAAEVAAQKVTAEDIRQLQLRFDELEKDEPDGEEKREKLFATDILLHQTIWKRCGNNEISYIINNYRDEIQRIRLSTLAYANRNIPTVREIEEIFKALKAQDANRAQKAMYEHIKNIKDAIEMILKKKRGKNR